MEVRAVPSPLADQTTSRMVGEECECEQLRLRRGCYSTLTEQANKLQSYNLNMHYIPIPLIWDDVQYKEIKIYNAFSCYMLLENRISQQSKKIYIAKIAQF